VKLTKSDTDADDALKKRLIDFFQTQLTLELRPEEADYILTVRYDSFCVALDRFTELESETNRDALLKIADAAIRRCSSRE
jgi:hypothetical protein